MPELMLDFEEKEMQRTPSKSTQPAPSSTLTAPSAPSTNGQSESIDGTLAERGKRYGAFKHQAVIACSIKRAMVAGRNWNHLRDSQKEALDMIANKIARILNGDHDYDDSWVDIAGYAQLIVKELHERV